MQHRVSHRVLRTGRLDIMRCYGRDIADYVLMGVKYISDMTGAYNAPIA